MSRGMKTCTKCMESLPEDQFHWKNKEKGKRIARCRTCSAVWSKAHYQRNKDMYVRKAQRWNTQAKSDAFDYVTDYLSTHPCVDCGEEDLVVLEFDHVRGTKKHDVSSIMQGSYGVAAVKAEIEKCDVRCANCHARKTAQQFGYRKSSL